MSSYFLATCPLAPLFSPFPYPVSLGGHGWPLLLYSLLSAFLWLYYSLYSPPHARNKLYSILYCGVAGPSGGGDALAWACGGTPLPHTLLEHILIALSLYMITTLVTDFS